MTTRTSGRIQRILLLNTRITLKERGIILHRYSFISSGLASPQRKTGQITIWLSRSGEFESMAASVPPKDDDAIEVTLAATQANRIVWLQPDRTSLAFGTEGSRVDALAFRGSGSDALHGIV